MTTQGDMHWETTVCCGNTVFIVYLSYLLRRSLIILCQKVSVSWRNAFRAEHPEVLSPACTAPMLSMALMASQTLPVIKHCWIDELQTEIHLALWVRVRFNIIYFITNFALILRFQTDSIYAAVNNNNIQYYSNIITTITIQILMIIITLLCTVKIKIFSF